MRYCVALMLVLVLAACAPKNETVRSDTMALGEWTMPSRVVVVGEPPDCEGVYRAWQRAVADLRVSGNAEYARAVRVIQCYRMGYEAL